MLHLALLHNLHSFCRKKDLTSALVDVASSWMSPCVSWECTSAVTERDEWWLSQTFLLLLLDCRWFWAGLFNHLRGTSVPLGDPILQAFCMHSFSWKLWACRAARLVLSWQFPGRGKRQKLFLNESFESEEYCRVQQKLCQNPEIMDSAVFSCQWFSSAHGFKTVFLEDWAERFSVRCFSSPCCTLSQQQQQQHSLCKSGWTERGGTVMC